MQNIVRILIAAIVLLILKAMFLDDYIKQYQSENNVSVEANASDQAAPSSTAAAAPSAESNVSDRNETNATGIHSRADFEKATEQGLFDRFVNWLAEKLSKKVPPPAEL